MTRLLSPTLPLLLSSCVLFAIAAAAQEPDPLDKPTQAWNEQFGGAVAISGDRAVVSAPYDQSLLGAHATGAVYVYRKSGDAWILEQVLYPYDFPEHNPQTEFGTSISISGDVIAVGAPFEDVGAYRRGVVYVFRHDGQQWQAEAKLTQGAYLGAHLFGFSVAVHGDRLVASRVDRRGIHSLGSFSCLNPPTMPGEAIVYDFTGASWEQTAVLEPTDGRGGAWFGNAVAVEGDRLAVSAYRWWDPEICDNFDRDRDGITDGTQRGKVYVYRLEDGQWIGEAELQPENVADGDQFGFSLAMSGNTIIAGAPFTDEVGSRFGAAYTYVLSGGEWALEDAFAGNDTNRNDRFGYAVDIDGDHAVVGAPRHRNDDLNTGAMYAFRRANGSWQQGLQITLGQKTGEFSDPGPLMFGEAVAVSQMDFVIGAPQDPRIDGEIAGVMVGSAWAYSVEKVFRAAVSADTDPTDAVVSLHPAFPNPTRDGATITFELSVPGPASLTLFDVLGRRVAVIADELRPAGEHRFHIDLSSFAAGIYHYRLEVDGHVLTRQLTRL
jgi:hypothetical protein